MARITKPLAVLLGELPGLSRLALTRLLAAIPHVGVVGTALTGEELVLKARALRPDIVIAGEAALSSLPRLAQQAATPVLLYTNATPLPGMMREAARWGVYDYLMPLLPEGHPHAAQQREELKRKLHKISPKNQVPDLSATQAGIIAPPRGVVVLGGSTGGGSAIEQVVSRLSPGLLHAVVVAVHLPAQFTSSLVDRLRRVATLPVQIAEAGSRLLAGRILVVPGGTNMVIRTASESPWHTWQLELAAEQPVGQDVPSVDMLLASAARSMGRKVLGVVLSGLGRDGTQGAQVVEQHGGQMLAQDEASAAVFAMPKSLIQAGLAAQVLPPHEIAGFINRQGMPTPSLGRYSVPQVPAV